MSYQGAQPQLTASSVSSIHSLVGEHEEIRQSAVQQLDTLIAQLQAQKQQCQSLSGFQTVGVDMNRLHQKMFGAGQLGKAVPQAQSSQAQGPLDMICKVLSASMAQTVRETIRAELVSQQRQGMPTQPQKPQVDTPNNGIFVQEQTSGRSSGTGVKNGLPAGVSAPSSTKKKSASAREVQAKHRQKRQTNMGIHQLAQGVHELAESHWELSQADQTEETHSWFNLAFKRQHQHKSTVLHLLGYVFPNYVPTSPDNKLVDLVRSRPFRLFSMFAILVNTLVSALGLDETVQASISDPPQPTWEGWEIIDNGFTIFFTLEVLIRVVADRAWFFLSPNDWAWNVFDFVLVCLSAFTTLFEKILRTGQTVDLTFLRSLRLIRIFRMLKLVRVMQFFTELRKLLYAVVSCVVSLFWAIMFLGMVMMIYSLFLMSAVSLSMDKVNQDPVLLEGVRTNFDGLGGCFLTLFSIVFGPDWVPPHRTLSEFGFFESLLLPVFVLLVQVGLMNIVIGVFAEASQRCPEIELVAEDQISEVERFVEAMLQIFKMSSSYKDGCVGERISREDFDSYFQKEAVQAYLASHELDMSHANLIFTLCDRGKTGSVDMHDFVMGMLRLKGLSKALDSKIICHALSAIESGVDTLRSDMIQIMEFVEDKFNTLEEDIKE